jgi:hypothetical protein
MFLRPQKFSYFSFKSWSLNLMIAVAANGPEKFVALFLTVDSEVD